MNIINIKKFKNQFSEKIKCNQKFRIDFADSQGDLWFMLSDNIKNHDPIHILSSEKLREPKSVRRYYYDNDIKNYIKFHYINSSFEDFMKTIGNKFMEIEKKAKKLFGNDENFKSLNNELQKEKIEDKTTDVNTKLDLN